MCPSSRLPSPAGDRVSFTSTSGDKSEDSPMEILLFNEPGTESAINDYMCTLQTPLLLI